MPVSFTEGSCTTHFSSPTLADLMTMLPELHPTHLSQNKASKLKHLRLVSKEMGSMVHAAVHSCSVNLGEGGASPSPEQLVRLLGRAHLKELTVNVTVTAGPKAPTVAQQLSTCNRQMQCLLEGMGPSISSVEVLKINVIHPSRTLAEISAARALAEQASTYRQLQRRSRQNLLLQQQQQGQHVPHHLPLLPNNSDHEDSDNEDSDNEDSDNEDPSFSDSDRQSDDEDSRWPLKVVRRCPQGQAVVAGSVFATLAAAVPNLQVLHLQGSCWDAALYAFGASCPKLVELDVDIRHVPVEALRDLGQHLPNLTTLSVGSYSLKARDQSRINIYMDAVLLEARQCRRLDSLQIDIAESLTLTCRPQLWSYLPASLQHMRCSCTVTPCAAYTALLRRLPDLGLLYPPVFDLIQLLQTFPALQNLTVLETEPMTLRCIRDVFSCDNDLIKQRLLIQAFQLSTYELSISGTCEQLLDLFAWLPAFSEIPSVSIELVGGEGLVPCLERLSFIFPELHHLTLTGEVAVAQTESMAAIFFKPLMACPILSILSITCANLTLTTPGLVELCSSMPELSELFIEGCGIAEAELEAALQALPGKSDMKVYATA